jgi:hypothetical protein
MSEEDEAKRRADAAAKRAAVLFERQQQSERRVTDEENRHSDMVAKTARLRKQRLERDAAEDEVRKDEPKPTGRGPKR